MTSARSSRVTLALALQIRSAAARFMARFAALGFTLAPETLALMRQLTESGELADLTAERANLRATDENVPIARSRGLPGVSSTGAYSESLSNTDSSVSASRSARGTPSASANACRRGTV